MNTSDKIHFWEMVEAEIGMIIADITNGGYASSFASRNIRYVIQTVEHFEAGEESPWAL